MAAGRREKGWRKETHDSTDLETAHIFLHYVTILNVKWRTEYSHFHYPHKTKLLIPKKGLQRRIKERPHFSTELKKATHYVDTFQMDETIYLLNVSPLFWVILILQTETNGSYLVPIKTSQCIINMDSNVIWHL
jgi:hypothetical protein